MTWGNENNPANKMEKNRMKFEMVTNVLFDDRDLANHVVKFKTQYDCEAAAKIAVDSLNKSAAKHGCISAVVCIIE